MEEKRLLNDILESIGDGIIVVDLEGYLVNTNNSFAKMLGYKKNELIGKHLLEISVHTVPEFSSEHATPMIRRLLAEGFVNNEKITYLKKDGSSFMAEVNIKSWKDNDGNMKNHIAIVHDISEQMVWEHKILEKEDFLRKIIHADPNLIFVKHRDGKYVEVSKSVAELFGTTADYVVGKTDLELSETRRLSVHEAEKIRADDMEVLDTGKQKYIEEESVTQTDGKIKWYQTTKVPLVRDNSADYVLGVAVDITLRKQALDLLKRKENELKVNNQNLRELNTALKIVLQQKENDREELEKKVLGSIKVLVEPYVNKLKNSIHNSIQKNLINIIESNLKEVTSPFSIKLSSEYVNLTAYEIQVADLIRKDFANKEIAEQLNMALETVSSHRKHIRKKLGLTNKKTNLSSYLKSLE